MTTISYRPLTGNQARDYLNDIAQLRIEIFHDFPYLYDGDITYEQKYLEHYFQSNTSFVVLCLDGSNIVGASTAIALVDESADLKAAFEARGYKPNEVFYFGESVLRKTYRGKGIGKEFFRYREEHARKMGATFAAFCGVVRPPDHPMRPKGYEPLDRFWHSQGFKPVADLVTYFQWKDIGDTEQTKKAMAFWMKELRA